jgi:hypothetical protein
MLLLISIFGIVLTGMVSPSIDQTPGKGKMNDMYIINIFSDHLELPLIKSIFQCLYGNFLATCVDGIKNQGEEKVDCGGPCWSCGIYFKRFYTFIKEI